MSRQLRSGFWRTGKRWVPAFFGHSKKIWLLTSLAGLTILGYSLISRQPEPVETSRFASPVIYPPPTGPSAVTVTKSASPGSATTISPNDTYNPGDPIAYTIRLNKAPGDPIVSLTIFDCLAGQPVLYGAATGDLDPIPPTGCNPVAANPNPYWVAWNLNSSENSGLLNALNSTGETYLQFYVVAQTVDACFDNTAYGGGAIATGEIEVGLSTVTSCIQHPRYPYLTTTRGDVHAGGGIGSGSCGTGGSIVGRTDGAGGGSRAEYILSAGASISSFYSGTAPGKETLTFGNSPALGYYGTLCRPNLVEAANRYNPRAAFGGALAGATDTLLVAGGGTSVAAQTVSNRVTLFVNGDVYINGNIRLSGASFTRATLPTFGLIASGSIYIAPGVTQLDGFYYAAGQIDTCYGRNISANGASACSAHLTVNGLLTAQSFKFKRTGSNGTYGMVESERFNYRGTLLVAPPPAFNDFITPFATRPRFDGERPPLR